MWKNTGLTEDNGGLATQLPLRPADAQYDGPAKMTIGERARVRRDIKKRSIVCHRRRKMLDVFAGSSIGSLAS